MGKKGFVYLIIAIIVFFFGSIYGDILAQERAALIALYNSTNGDNWVNNDGWKTPPLHTDGFAMPGTEGTWHGVTVEDNHVIRVDFIDNNLNGTLPSELQNLVYLKNLSLANNDHLTGNIPPTIGNINGLQELILVHNQLTGGIPIELGNLTNLIYLSLATNQLTGTIPTELSNLLNLKVLRLDSNQLTGSIPVVLSNLIQLEELFLLFNQLTGTIPPQLGNLANLRHLYLYNNQLSGSIPSSLGNLSNLTALSLEFNQLTGDIPPELGNLEKLQDLRLRNNNLTNIPGEIGNLTELQVLYLGNNKITGTIPSELANLSKLYHLGLNNNQLSGEIPTELGNLINLEFLYLNNNKLSGEIPTSLINLTKLSNPYLDIGYNCLYSNDTALRAWLDSVDPDWESYQSECNTGPPEISVNREQLNFGYVIGGNNPSADTVTIFNSGGGTLLWNVSSDTQWITLTPVAGVNSGVVEVAVNPVGLTPGEYEGIIFVSDPQAVNSPVEVVVNLQVNDASPPFGEFSTPLDNATVSSSVPVTGWALGDTGIESVKIYREEGKNLVYIGDGVLVEGARPDVESAYPGYPMNYKAGWGYMMLTNFLPNGGNGTFKIHAIATDKEGQPTTLGIKTITIDNANAVKPFGAIDTPGQGGTASGGSYINWGWVLTPRPNQIPTDGSTINVWVDGVNIGNPTYNIYREDIATLFPGYENSNGAAGYFYLDTTAYENGVHTIQWTATDNAGNTDGIGSRYFTIQNTGGGAACTTQSAERKIGAFNVDVSRIPADYSGSVILKEGFNEKKRPQAIYHDDNGIIEIEIKELERIVIQLEGTMGLAPLSNCTGFLVIDHRFRSLPIGSTLDTKRGVFSWQPGPGFYGTYEFIFIKADGSDRRKVRVRIKILPKCSMSLE
jgi:Leucine-rich repeat (LRR) protein